ncbi:MAG: glutamine--fructose-6-phosphate transaminase (isomerizing), partial [Acidobacteriota bacterium]
MCGIIGYVGDEPAVPILMGGLRQLEYRGYDSAGLAVVNDSGVLDVRRAAGKLGNLERVLRADPLEGSFGVGHTRWATHGAPTEENAHPHRDSDGKIVVVHNGIIENYLQLRERLSAVGHAFVTETDTETIVHLISEYFEGNLEVAVRRALVELEGIYAIAVMAVDDPQKIVAARQGPPLVVGLGEGEQFVASDVTPILQHSRSVVFLDDGQIAVVTPDEVRVTDLAGKEIEFEPQRITWDPVTAQKGGYRHFMLKEIHEQPEAVRDSLVGRLGRVSGAVAMAELQIDGKPLDEGSARGISKLFVLACGTSWHAGLVGKFWIESLAGIPVEVDYGSEFRYRDPLVPAGTVALAITQSGETADTLAAMREAREKGASLWTICNVVGSMATRLAAGVIHTHAGPEIGVASTKAFTTQLACLYQLALRLAQLRGTLTADEIGARVEDLVRIPTAIENTLQREDSLVPLARRLAERSN